MTTAEAREQARIAEAKLDWAKAGELWQIAVDNYPAHNGSALAIADIARLQKRATGCKEFAESQTVTEYDADDFNSVSSRHHY